jgi:hypothetical protein
MTSLRFLLDNPDPDARCSGGYVKGLANVIDRHPLLHQLKRIRLSFCQSGMTV